MILLESNLGFGSPSRNLLNNFSSRFDFFTAFSIPFAISFAISQPINNTMIATTKFCIPVKKLAVKYASKKSIHFPPMFSLYKNRYTLYITENRHDKTFFSVFHLFLTKNPFHL